jgi:hypothetical protein
MTFDYTLDFSTIDFRKRPELYRIGKGEQGVLLVEPYKSEILPHWQFKTAHIARSSARRIYQIFLDYRAEDRLRGNGYGSQISPDGLQEVTKVRQS